MHRFENQRRATLIQSMTTLLENDNYARGVSELQAWMIVALYTNLDCEFNGLLDEHNLKLETLTYKVMANSRSVFLKASTR